MKLKRALFGLVLPLMLTVQPSLVDRPILKSSRWDQIAVGDRVVTNNTWGAPETETLACTIYALPNGHYGWDWNRPKPEVKPGVTTAPPIYPAVRVGGSPWKASASPHFPVKLAEVKSLESTVSYAYPTPPTGSYNLAYDIFFTNSTQPSATPTIKAEVMVWLQGTAKQPPSAFKGDFGDGHNTYSLYSWVMRNGRVYYSFLMKGSPENSATRTVDFKKLIDNLKLDPGLYIPGIEFGDEVFNGAGKIEISKLSIILNGKSV